MKYHIVLTSKPKDCGDCRFSDEYQFCRAQLDKNEDPPFYAIGTEMGGCPIKPIHDNSHEDDEDDD